METARGRWFLAEYARRNRTADTTMLLDAIGRLQNAVVSHTAESEVMKFRKDLLQMAEAIADAKREIAAMRPAEGDDSRIEEATLELDAIVESTEKATSEILYAAEQVQEIAWGARENGTPDAVCDAIDAHVTEIYTACSFQDLTGQRTQKVVKVLRYIENRIHAMVSIWDGESVPHAPDHADADHRPDAHLLNGPQLAGKGKSQDEINAMMVTEADIDDVVFVGPDGAVDDVLAPEDSASAAEVVDEPAVPVVEEEAAEPLSDACDPHAASQDDEMPVAEAADTSVSSPDSVVEEAAVAAVAVDTVEPFAAEEPENAEVEAPAISETDVAAGSVLVESQATVNEDGSVSVPSLHEAVFETPQQVAPKADDTRAMQAIAATIERNVAAPEPKAGPVQPPGHDLESLTTLQKMVLFS